MDVTVPVVITRGRQSDDGLKLSADRKVTPRASYQESRHRWVPKITNSFGLPSGITCPGMTDFCTGCYAARSEQSNGVADLLQHNLRLLTYADLAEKIRLLDEMIGKFSREAARQGVRPVDTIFRIHWDGDFFSTEYAEAWAVVVDRYPHIKFWAYTRSFTDEVNVVPILARAANLTLYLSIDSGNYDLGLQRLKEYPTVRPAWCARDEQEGWRLAAGRPATICPENMHTLALIERGRGACVRCKLCPDDNADIIFLLKKPRKPRNRRQGVLDLTPRELGEMRNCAHCGRQFFAKFKRGRPKKYCDKYCRWDASRVK